MNELNESARQTSWTKLFSLFEVLAYSKIDFSVCTSAQLPSPTKDLFMPYGVLHDATISCHMVRFWCHMECFRISTEFNFFWHMEYSTWLLFNAIWSTPKNTKNWPILLALFSWKNLGNNIVCFQKGPNKGNSLAYFDPSCGQMTLRWGTMAKQIRMEQLLLP